MPLSELWTSRRRSDPNQGFEPLDDTVELVWENGQIMMQDHSNRARKSPNFNNLPSHTSRNRDRDLGNGSNGKMGKFRSVESVIDEIPLSVPAGEMGLSDDDDMLPWLNYALDQPIQHEYNHDYMPEMSGVINANEISTNGSLASIDKRSSTSQLHRELNTDSTPGGSLVEQRNVSKLSSVSAAEAIRPITSTTHFDQMSSQESQASIPSRRLVASDMVGRNTSSAAHHAVGKNSIQASLAGGFPGIPMQKLNPPTSSNIVNFSHFSRSATLPKANLQNGSAMPSSSLLRVEKIKNKDKVSVATSSNPSDSILIKSSCGLMKESNSQCQDVMTSSGFGVQPTVSKPVEEPCMTKNSEAGYQEDSAKNNDGNSNHIPCESAIRALPDAEKTTEPVIDSSVCSGNGVEKADDSSQALKRKSRDTDDSECHSEDVEEESVGVKEVAHGRGTGSKRSRAAEVHNLSERRRRDRINEKMRALQELIPNCNKVDKASMLDEAIEYLKTLQLQVQIMSMGAGMYTPQMMLPPGMQHMHALRMAHFSHMGLGMGLGLGMGYGMGLPDMNGGSLGYPMLQVPPTQGSHFTSSQIPGHTAFNGMMGSNLVFGLPGQGGSMQMQRPPSASLSGGPFMKSVVGPNACGAGGPVKNVESAPTSISKDSVQNMSFQTMQTIDANDSMNQTSNQVVFFLLPWIEFYFNGKWKQYLLTV